MATFYAGQVDYISALNTLVSTSTKTIVTATSTYTAPTITGTLVVLCNTTTSGFTVNLPTAVGNSGIYIIKKIVALNTLTIDGNSSQTIDNSATVAITTLNSVITLISDGSNWRVI